MEQKEHKIDICIKIDWYGDEDENTFEYNMTTYFNDYQVGMDEDGLPDYNYDCCDFTREIKDAKDALYLANPEADVARVNVEIV